MNRMKTTALAARAAAGLLASTYLGASFAATLTVSPGQSIQAAVNAAVAGDTVHVLAGTYIEKVLISGKSGTAGAFITLSADKGAIISGSGLKPSGRQGLITIKNSNYVRVEGFEVMGFATGADAMPVGILVDGNGAHLQIVGNKIHDIRHTSTCFGDDGGNDDCQFGAHGLAVYGTNATGVTDLLVQNNEVYKNVLQASEALVLNGNVDRFEVVGNNVHDNNNIGFDFIGYENECNNCGESDRVRNGVVRQNIAKNNSSVGNPWYGTDGSASGFYVDGGRYILFDRNTSTGNDSGFEFASEHGGKATEDILMTDNVVFYNRQAGLSLGGSKTAGGQARNIQVNNNSFYLNNRAAKPWGAEIFLQNKVVNSSFANNIIYGGGTVDTLYQVDGSGNSGNVWGVNLWFGAGSGKLAVPGTQVNGDPLYLAPQTGDLHLQAASPAIAKGALGVALTTWKSPIWTAYFPSGAIPVNGATDFDGQARVENGIDLGADEVGTAAPARR